MQFLNSTFHQSLSFTGHFSALVPSEPYQRLDAAREEEEDVTFLPLMDCENKLLPIHFLSQAEVGCCQCCYGVVIIVFFIVSFSDGPRGDNHEVMVRCLLH